MPFLITVASSALPLVVRQAQESCLIAHLYHFFPGIRQFSKRDCSLSLEKLCSRNSCKWLAERIIIKCVLPMYQFVCPNHSEPHRKIHYNVGNYYQ